MDGNTNFVSDDARWAALTGRDARADGAFWFGVVTTGIYCAPSCPARRPRRENVRYFDDIEAAARAGFRPCKRCRPDDPFAQRIADICRWVEAREEMPPLAAMASRAGLSPGHFHRLFRRALGITPKQFTDAVLARRVRAGLACEPTVTSAIYKAGFTGASGFYDAAGARLGMTPGIWRKGGEGVRIRWAVSDAALGKLLVAATDRGICAIALGDDAGDLVDDLRRRFPKAMIEPAEPGSAFDGCVKQTIALVERPGAGFGLPLDIQGTAFQEKVWRALQAIPPGETATYAGVAAAIGQPGAARAVAGACAANPVAVAIPCHRVVRADGALSGYRWGVERKRALLDREKQK
ncbi:MAG: bifunctional DNA-binding transcriptional regulator/O6-methylguanine-DNA methyltransferase Ada [Alphaproteobacteria bacterium]